MAIRGVLPASGVALTYPVIVAAEFTLLKVEQARPLQTKTVRQDAPDNFVVAPFMGLFKLDKSSDYKRHIEASIISNRLTYRHIF
jgi:hypothetical protein